MEHPGLEFASSSLNSVHEKRISAIVDPSLVDAKQYKLPQIKWEIPSKFVLASDWHVVSGEESEEKDLQKLRESTVLEALYRHSSIIPHNPFFPPDIENQYYNDRQTPLIPIIPIEEAEPTTTPPSNLSTVLQHPVASHAAESDASFAAVAVVTTIMRSLIDTDLLKKILSDPTTTTKPINEYCLATDNISIPSKSNMPENCQLSLPRMPAGDALSLPVSKPSLFLSLKEDHGGHDNAGNAHVAARTDPPMKKTTRDYGLPDNLQRNNNPATESLLAPAHITKDYNAKTAVSMLKDINYYKSLVKQHGADTDTWDHEQSPHRNKQGNLQKPEFSNKKHQKACININKPGGCNRRRCRYRHETYNQQRPTKRMKLDSVDSLAADESALHSPYHMHSPYHIITEVPWKINKPFDLGVAMKDADSPAADSLHSSYHISTDASREISKPSGWRMAVNDVDSPAADELSLHSFYISTDASCKTNEPSGLGMAVKDVDSSADDESSLHSSYHVSTDASCKTSEPSGLGVTVKDVDNPAVDESSYSYHISTDAAWKINKPSGLGVVIKDGNGHLLEAWSDSKHGIPSSLIAEGFALRWALSESLQRKWDNIHLISDCKNLVDGINGASRCPSSCKDILDEIVSLKSNFRSCVISFVPRNFNVHAHKLAHFGTSLTKKVCVKVLSQDGFSSIGD